MFKKGCRFGLRQNSASDLQEGFRCLDKYIEFLNDSIRVCGYASDQQVGMGHMLGEFEVNPLDGLPEKVFGLSGKYPLKIHIHDDDENRIVDSYFDLLVNYSVGLDGKSPKTKVNTISSGRAGILSASIDSPLLTGKFPDDLVKIRDCCMDIKNALGAVCSPYASSLVYEP